MNEAICDVDWCVLHVHAKGFCEKHYWRHRHGYPMDKPFKRVLGKMPLAEKLMARCEIDPNSGCWLWTGAADKHGYGAVSTGPAQKDKAYRASFRQFVGPIPDRLHVLHRCDTPACINPAHLFLGTQADNMKDMGKKGRANGGPRKLTPETVREIRRLASSGISQAALAIKFGVGSTAISRTVARTRWGHI